MVARADVAKLFAEAVRLYQARRLPDAESLCRQVIAVAPDVAAVQHLAGRIALERERPQEAVAALTRAAQLQPRDPALLLLLGTALLQLDRVEAALARFEAVLALDPKIAEAQCARGVALARLDRQAPAIAAFAASLELNPALTESHVRLANLYAARGDTVLAIGHYRAALGLDPDNAFCHHRLGVALAAAGDKDAALGHYRQAVRLKPGFLAAQYALEGVLALAGRWAETVEGYELWVRAEPASAEAHFHLGVTQLRLGQFEAGWQHDEWHWQRAAKAPERRPFPQPLWRGEDLAGRTLLVHDEEGFGDALQFCRYLPLVAGRCVRLVFEARPELFRLMHRSFESERVSVIPRRSFPSIDGLPATDYHAPLLRLPGLVGTRLETIPADIPYLQPDPDDVGAWADRLAGLARPLVGLVWAGQQQYFGDAYRSISLAQLAPLGQIPGASFLSLQIGPAAAQAADPPPGLALLDFTSHIKDFADSAALLAEIDLLITVDTAAAHLAGALGTEIWLLNRLMSSWRWLLEREDSPWYPSLRQFRQDETAEWDSVIPRVADALAAYVERYRSG